MIRRRGKIAAVLAVGALAVAACGSDDNSASETTTAATTAETTAATTAETTPATTAETTPATEPAPSAWAVNTDDCVDPEAANAPIEGTLMIGSAMPLTGGVAAAAFAPVKSGFESYIKYANEKGLVPGIELQLTIEDDQYNAELTPGAIAKQIDGGTQVFSGIIGTPNNAAVRDTLNDECIPQLNALTGSPSWGELADYPWTTGILIPYTVESKIYAAQIAELYPEGATVSLFYVNNEFGQVYADAFKAIAGDYNLTVVGEQTIEATDSNPPASQVTTIASEKADVVMAVPLGAGCISFLGEMASAKAQNADWKPATFITNTCASSLILGAAGPAANGLYTSGNLKDVGDPAVQAEPAVKEYIDYMTAEGYGEIVATAVAGWHTGEITVAIIKQAAESPEGLTRASIINAARDFTYTPSLARDGVQAKSIGEEDPFLFESLTVLQYDATSATFTDVGKLIADFES